MSESSDIRWQSAHERLHIAGQLLEQAFNPTEESVLKTLAERAERAARPVDTADDAVHERTLLLIQAGRHVGGIAMGWVKEVVPLSHGHVLVPEADERLLGLINVHNQLVNLVSPWPLLNESPATGAAHFPYAVLLRHAHLKLAIGCDRALRLATLPEDAWQGDRLFIHDEAASPGVLMNISALVKSWEPQSEPARP